ncbi:hypothetical protein ACLB2K_016566 [Fragaria x ananassa]
MAKYGRKHIKIKEYYAHINSDYETGLTIPQSTGNENSRKHPAEDEEEVVEYLRYQREYGLIRHRHICPRLDNVEGATWTVEVNVPEPDVVVAEEQSDFLKEVEEHPLSPTGVPDDIDLMSVSSPVLSAKCHPEVVPSPLRLDSATQVVEEQKALAVSAVPLPVPEVEPVTPAPVKPTNETPSSLATRTASLRARVIPPANPELVRLARDFLHGLMRQGPNMDVFELVRHAHKAYDALVRHLTCSNPLLDRSLELINAVKLHARRVNDAEAQSAAQEKIHQSLGY